MMGRPPRVPIDLQEITRDVKALVRRVIGELEAIEQEQDPIFASPRDVFLELVLSIHEPITPSRAGGLKGNRQRRL